MKATALANKLGALVREYGRDLEVRLAVYAPDGTCLGVSDVDEVEAGEDVTETQFLITLSGTEGQG